MEQNIKQLVGTHCIMHLTIKAYRTVEIWLQGLTALLTGKETWIHIVKLELVWMQCQRRMSLQRLEMYPVSILTGQSWLIFTCCAVYSSCTLLIAKTFEAIC